MIFYYQMGPVSLPVISIGPSTKSYFRNFLFAVTYEQDIRFT